MSLLSDLHGRKLHTTVCVTGLIILVMCYTAIYLLIPPSFYMRHEDTDTTTLRDHEYLVDTPSCKIPKVDPFDKSVRHIVHQTGSITCKRTPKLTYEDGLHLRVNRSAMNENEISYSGFQCKYTPIYRPKYLPTSHNNWKYINISAPFNDSVVITDDFVRVSCYNATGTEFYTNFHTFIQPNITHDNILKERFKEHQLRDNNKEHLNVIMLGVDSVSRLNFLRQMVKTSEFLSETVDAVDMMGYNKVADNTFVNIVPMMLGKFVAEMSWNKTLAGKPFDDFNFIWRQFSAKGYKTYYSEDAPAIAIFDYVKSGFNTPPADYFNRPMSLAMEKMHGLWSNNHHCFQGRLETEILLDNLFTFVQTFRHVPYFALTFISRLTHNYVNNAGAADQPYYDFLKKLHDNELLTNTVLFFFSDHGMRFGKIRETHIGKLEERLPFMTVAVPELLRKKYGLIRNNLYVNRNRLSTPFDVYETLMDILRFNKGVQEQAITTDRGVSWFREIPITRSCDQAGILPHWCTCHNYARLNVTDISAQNASRAVLSEIVHALRNFTDKCENLRVLEIKEASRLVGSDNVLKSRQIINRTLYFGEETKSFEDVQVVIVTAPGSARFEATVRIYTLTDTYAIVSDISRINRYGHHGDCISDSILRKFCQCRQGLKPS